MFPFLIAASKSLQRACLRIIFELYDLLFLSRCASCNEMGERPFCHLCQDALLHAPLPLHATNFIGSLWLYGGPLAQAFIQAKLRAMGWRCTPFAPGPFQKDAKSRSFKL